MKLGNIINKALSDMNVKGYTTAKIIKTIKDNFDKKSDDYDFMHICVDCHYAFNETDNYDSDNAINANHSVERLKTRYKYHYYLDSDEFSHKPCDCCNSKLSGNRFFYACTDKPYHVTKNYNIS